MYASRQRDVQPASTNRPSHTHTHWVSRRRDAGPGANWIARATRSSIPPTTAQSRFESASRRRGGQSGGGTPVPIPNTEVKPASVPASTGVREPLGTAVRRLTTHTSCFRGVGPATAVAGRLVLRARWGVARRRERSSTPDGALGGSPIAVIVGTTPSTHLFDRLRYCYLRQGGRVWPNASACRADHPRFKSGPWLPFFVRSTDKQGECLGA